MSIDPSWPVLGRTDNATFYLADPRVIVVAPDEGCTDDETTARQSIGFQQSYWKTHGRRGAAVVLMDRVNHQTRDARRVYQEEVDSTLVTAFGLVSGTMFGNAVGSVFLGLARPAIPTCMFGDVAAALQWVRSHHETLARSEPDADAAADSTEVDVA